MKSFMHRFVSDEGDGSSALPPQTASPVNEHEALDAYSRVIVTVAETLGPAVVNLRGVAGEGGRARRDRDRAFCSRRTAFCLRTITWCAA